jgi:GMP synthase-like glutamine amidotransferase
MICYVDIEHDKVLKDPDKRDSHLAGRMEIKLRLEEISGEPCLVQRYSDLTRQRLVELGVKALLISGNGTPWDEYADQDLAEMYDIIRSARLPILGFCGGCQLIAMAHGVRVDYMRPLRNGEQDARPNYREGWLKESGFMPVRVLQPDPLFKSLGDRPVFYQAHAEEVKTPPPDFQVLASSDACPIQALKQVDKLVYGTQFHPEWFSEEQTDGRQLLTNFFEIVGIL